MRALVNVSKVCTQYEKKFIRTRFKTSTYSSFSDKAIYTNNNNNNGDS